MENEIPSAEFERIRQMIEDPTSPVGIDARKTHVIILYKLEQLERRLADLQRTVDAGTSGGD